MKGQLAPGENVSTGDVTADYAVLDLMGPQVADIVSEFGAGEINRLGYFHCCAAAIKGIPFQAGLEFTLDWRSEFIDKAALLERRDQPPAGRLLTIVFDSVDAQPLGNEPVYHRGQIIGKTTSAAFGYRVGKPVAIALIDGTQALKLDGRKVDVDIAGGQNAGIISTNAAWDAGGLAMTAAIR